jgi:tripartite-type tricarboxylate transporter receptor subunit TctC
VPVVGDFVPGSEASAINGVAAPKNTPAEIIEELNKQINFVISDPRMKARFAELGSMVVGGSAADYGRMLADETDKWRNVIRTGNIKLQ